MKQKHILHILIELWPFHAECLQKSCCQNFREKNGLLRTYYRSIRREAHAKYHAYNIPYVSHHQSQSTSAVDIFVGDCERAFILVFGGARPLNTHAVKAEAHTRNYVYVHHIIVIISHMIRLIWIFERKKEANKDIVRTTQ